MIYYPLFSMKEAGITDILIVSGTGHAGNFLELLGSGAQFGLKIAYEVQEEAGGIAQALGMAENFAGKEKIMVILGDNIFEDNLAEAAKGFLAQEKGAKLLLKSVKNPKSYGVADVSGSDASIGAGESIKSIVEKPENPPSDLAVVGCYMYDSQVFTAIKGLKPSGRNELEITDVNNFYLAKGELTHEVLNGFWGDCGESFDSLMESGHLIQKSRLSKINEKLELAK